VDPRERLYEPATAADAMLCAGGGKTLYLGTLDYVDWHLHSVPAFVAGLRGDFRLRYAGEDWLTCRAAVIPAGVCHALDAGGEPLAVFYPEPNVANLSNLARLGVGWDQCGHILLARHPGPDIFRELYENPSSLEFSGEALDHLVNFMQAIDGPPALDPRLARVLRWLNTRPADPTPAGQLADALGLSVSRFLHLFSQQIGVPFRRFRIWIRLRAASQMALSGRSLTEAAHSAGFSDSAHFARLHRDTFGVTPSYTFRKLARVGRIAPFGASDKFGPSSVSPEAR